jgi:glutamate formiminotransferase / 5-formyltetrahydrofolate cyclo-ligase
MTAELFEAIPNFSEGRDLDAIHAITAGAAPAYLLDADPDPDHNRMVVSLAAGRKRLTDALVGAVAVAAERIDLRRHRGLHPRVGAADVVPIVPLHGASLEDGRTLARELGGRIWRELQIPVFFYGHGESRTLADVRAGRTQPDLGGPEPHPTAGAVCVGARSPLIAFNVLLPDTSAAEARVLARSLREVAGGMRGVQALVFELPGGRVQLSMNLVRTDETAPAAVVHELERRGVSVGLQQLVGLCPARLANPAAAGRLLEGRLAAAAARDGASRCAARGGDEHSALAGRLAREAQELAALGIRQQDYLEGAERCGALSPVLAAAGVLDPVLKSMLKLATRGLRDALTAETLATYPARAAALERRLDRSD